MNFDQFVEQAVERAMELRVFAVVLPDANGTMTTVHVIGITALIEKVLDALDKTAAAKKDQTRKG